MHNGKKYDFGDTEPGHLPVAHTPKHHPVFAAVKPGREAEHSHPSSAEVKNTWSYTSTYLYVFMEWYLITHRIHLHGE
jgi:hypothetical protein